MSSTSLQVESVPSGAGSVGAWIDRLDALLGEAADLDMSGERDRAVVEAVRRLGTAGSRLAAVKLAAVAEVDRRGAARRATGASSTAAWLRADGMAAGAAAREVALAGALVSHEATREALASGSITPDHAGVIAGLLDSLSEAVPDGDRAATEERLLRKAGHLDPHQLRKEAVAQAALVDPSGAGDLERRERAMRARRDLRMWRDRDGMHHLRGQLDPEGAATVMATLDPLAAPRPSSVDGPDSRSPGRRLADALVEACQRLLGSDTLPGNGGLRPTVVVTMTMEQLLGAGCGSAQVAGATVREPVSPGRARKLACDAGLIPAVLGGDSQVLDLGRRERTASAAQRRALAIRDQGCTAPGCDRPPEWCEAHHLVPWALGGLTDVDQMTLVCDAHHDIAHQDGWVVTNRPGEGVRWKPPPTPPPEPPW